MSKVQLLVGADRQPTFDQALSQIGKYIELNKDQIGQSLLLGLFNPENPFNIANLAVVKDKVNRSQALMDLSSTEVVQPMDSKSFNPKSGLKLSGSVMNPEMFKIDELFNYIEIWKDFGTNLLLKQNTKVPNEQNTLEYHDLFIMELQKRVSADLRRVLFTGVKQTGTNANDVIDGFVAQFKAAVAANRLTPKAIVATSSANVASKIIDFTRQLGPIIRRSPNAYIGVASNVYNMIQGLAITDPQTFQLFSPLAIQFGNNGMATTDYLVCPIHRNIKIYEEPNLPDNGMYATIKDNLVVGFDTTSFDLRSREHFREIAILGEGMISCGVREYNPWNGKAEETKFIANDALVA